MRDDVRRVSAPKECQAFRLSKGMKYPLFASVEPVEGFEGVWGLSCALEPFSRLYGLLRAKSDKGEERSVPFLILAEDAETIRENGNEVQQPVMCLGEFE